MAAKELEAFDLLEQGNKKANYKSFFGGNKFEEAGELYQRAANIFKGAKKWDEAGQAFMLSADMSLRLNEKNDAANKYADAAVAYKKLNPKEAVNAYKAAIEILVDQGSFGRAAKFQNTVAEIYETDIADLEKAMQSYEIAADWFSAEDSQSTANAAKLKVGSIAAQLENYEKAIEKFEQVAFSSIDSTLGKFSVKDHLLKAGLCTFLLHDNVASRKAIQKYQDMDTSFSSTRECKLLMDIMDAIDLGDVDKFTAHVADFDRMLKLDPWKTTILLRIKNTGFEKVDDLT